MEDPLILGGVFTVVGSALMLLNKMLDKLPQFKSGHSDPKTAKHLDSIAKSCENMAEIIAGPYGRREDGTFKIHNLPEIEGHIRNTSKTVGDVHDKLTEITGG